MTIILKDLFLNSLNLNLRLIWKSNWDCIWISNRNLIWISIWINIRWDCIWISIWISIWFSIWNSNILIMNLDWNLNSLIWINYCKLILLTCLHKSYQLNMSADGSSESLFHFLSKLSQPFFKISL